VKDKFGLSWQVVPPVLIELIQDTDPVKSQRAMAAMMKMKKLDIAKLKAAYAGD
jgi:predicted 3-demethylubiquinone-9 3-methyltransferase (glyoxalase superfamily)